MRNPWPAERSQHPTRETHPSCVPFVGRILRRQARRMTAMEELRAYSTAGIIVSLLTLCGCQGLSSKTTPPNSGINSINHIVVMVQENRSFDTYFGQLPAYWAANGFPAQQLDGMPANASNPGYNGALAVPAYHLATECIELLSPSWDESHLDWNLQDPSS